MIRLYDPEATIPVVVAGTTFHLKQPTNADRFELMEKIQQVMVSTDPDGNQNVTSHSWRAQMNIVAGCVSHIDLDYEDSEYPAWMTELLTPLMESKLPPGVAMRNFIQQIASVADQGELLAHVVKNCYLQAEESKNSDSSSKSQPTQSANSTENAEAGTDVETESAST